MEELMIKIENVSKQYKLGQIGGTTLREELQRKRAKRLGKEDPTKKIGTKDYKDRETFMALDDVSFDVKLGERVGIIGHNGAGKSTLLKLLSRVTAPTSGRIRLNGRVASMLEVGTGFHGELTGRENIYMNGAILGMTKKEIDAKMDDIIEFSECRQFIDTPVKRYSSGMYVKLAFSVAAHLDSEIMIMDEVLAVGDMKFQEKCLGKMGDVSREDDRTILYVSHNMNTIRNLCTRCVVLDHGKVIFNGDVEEGISTYLEASSQSTNYIDYRTEEPVQWITKNKIKLLSVEYPEKESCVFEQGESIKLRMKWRCLEKTENQKVRIVLRTQDNYKVAATFSNLNYLGSPNQIYQGTFELDMSYLAPGNYQTIVVFFEMDKQGNEATLEWRRGLDIVIDNSKKGEVISWKPLWWGHLMLPEPKLILEELAE